jgi:hypothetical protein
MSPIRGALLVFPFLICPCFAQPRSGTAQPDLIDFGVLRTGAIVEGSALVYEAGTDPDIEFKVSAPKRVKILGKSVEARQFGVGNNFVCGSVEFAIETNIATQIDGNLDISFGRQHVKLPIRAIVEKAEPGRPRILIVATPFNRYSTDNGVQFRDWTDIAKAAKVDVSYLLVRREKPVLRDIDLGRFDCILLADEGLFWVTPEDVQKARQFAQKGGRVVVTANQFMMGTIAKANQLLDGLGMEFRDMEGRGDAIVPKDGLDERVTDAAVHSVHFFRASPIKVDDVHGQVLVKAQGVGEAGDAFVARARVRRGEMIAIGESLWWSWITKQKAGNADNGKLLMWLLAPPKGS